MTRPKSSTPNDIDPAAREILFRKHWSTAGWTKAAITPAEFAYAKRAGLMFDPVDVFHDAVVERALELRRRITPAEVGKAFLASLSTRQPGDNPP